MTITYLNDGQYTNISRIYFESKRGNNIRNSYGFQCRRCEQHAKNVSFLSRLNIKRIFEVKTICVVKRHFCIEHFVLISCRFCQATHIFRWDAKVSLKNTFVCCLAFYANMCNAGHLLFSHEFVVRDIINLRV